MNNPADRSVGLADLAARAQSGASSRPGRGRSDCRNPECVNGMTPGLQAAGGGAKGQPLYGAGGVGAKKLMRWAWVQCLACNAPEGARRAGAVYRHLNLTETQIAQRASLANLKAAYQEELKPLNPAARRPGFPTPPQADDSRLAELMKANEALSARLDEMLKQNAKTLEQNAEMSQTLNRMAMQIGALLEDNAKLRAASPPPLPPLEVKSA